MHKIQSVYRVGTRLLSSLPGAYDHVVSSLLKDFSEEMLKQGCLDISTESIPTGVAVWDMDRTEFKVVGYALSQWEIKEAVDLTKSIRVASGKTKEDLVNRLLKILTEMPDK